MAWATGDGAQVTCNGPGVAWRAGLDEDASTCTHTYRKASDAQRDGRFILRATATILLENTAPASGRSDYLIGNTVGLPLGWNRSYVSIYSALVPTEVRLDGKPLDLGVERELGLNVVSDNIDIGPGATRRIDVDLEGGLDLADAWYRSRAASPRGPVCGRRPGRDQRWGAGSPGRRSVGGSPPGSVGRTVVGRPDGGGHRTLVTARAGCPTGVVR